MIDTPTIIAHYHLYKNAGSSVDAAMRSYFGKENVVELDKDPRYRDSPAFNADLVDRVLADHPGMRGFASHTFVPTIHRSTAFRTIPIVFLRHPLLRLASVYRFEAISNAHKNTPSGKIAQTSSFAEWLEEYILMHNGKNYQTCVLSIQEDGEHSPFTNEHPMHSGDVRVAAERLDEVAEITCVGLVERFDEAARIIEDKAARYFPGFTLATKAENRTKHVDAWQDELAAVKAELSNDLYGRMVEANASDFALYNRYR